MGELIEKYLERFNENFPLFSLMGAEEADVEAIIQDCLDKEPHTGHLNWLKKTYIDDQATPGLAGWWFFHTISPVGTIQAVNRTVQNRGS